MLNRLINLEKQDSNLIYSTHSIVPKEPTTYEIEFEYSQHEFKLPEELQKIAKDLF